MKHYEFNKHTLLYQEQNKIKILLKPIIITILITLLMINLFYLSITTPREQILIQENKELLQKYVELDLRLTYGFQELYKLKQQDAYLYHNVILNDEYFGLGGVDEEIDSINLRQHFDYKVEQFLNQLTNQRQSLSQTTNKIEELTNIPSMMPIKTTEYTIPSEFGLRYHPILKTVKLHKGIDFGIPTGTEIYSTANGIIKFIQCSDKGYGNLIIIQHDDFYETYYAHLNNIIVHQNDTVFRGQLIGKSGNTGLSTGPHLHYEVRKYGVPQNPIDYISFDEKYTKKLIENLDN